MPELVPQFTESPRRYRGEVARRRQVSPNCLAQAQGIHLRGFAQKNPKQEYKREAFEMFGTMLTEITRNVIGLLSRVEVKEKNG